MSAECVIGVDLGGTKLLAGAIDRELCVHHRAHRASAGVDTATLLDAIESAVLEVARGGDMRVAAVGLGIPAQMDCDRGTVSLSNHLPLDDVPIRDLMAERLGLPVVVDNDANLALLAELRGGTTQGCTDAVMLTLGTGIGGAILAGGQILRGSQGAAGELGHITVQTDGPPCPGKCPNRGCLEAMASGTALGEAAVAMATSRPDSALARAVAGRGDQLGRLVTQMAHDGDVDAISLVADAGRWLGVGIASLLNIFDPEVVVVGGGMVAAGEFLLEPARDEVRLRALAPTRSHARIVAARFGDEAGMLGAALLAMERMSV